MILSPGLNVYLHMCWWDFAIWLITRLFAKRKKDVILESNIYRYFTLLLMQFFLKKYEQSFLMKTYFTHFRAMCAYFFFLPLCIIFLLFDELKLEIRQQVNHKLITNIPLVQSYLKNYFKYSVIYVQLGDHEKNH
jgi:hypothetical protein